MSKMLQFIDTGADTHYAKRGFWWWKFEIIRMHRIWKGIAIWLTFKELFTQRIDKKEFIANGFPMYWGLTHLINDDQSAVLHPIPLHWVVRWCRYHLRGKLCLK